MDRQRVAANAQKFFQKGQYDKAIQEYLKLLAADPTDIRLLLRLGDLESRIGKNQEALDHYRRAAQHYLTEGFLLKAMGVFKQMRKLAPQDLPLAMELALLYEQVGLQGDAKRQYEEVVSIAASRGEVMNRVRALQSLAELEPTQERHPLRLADALALDGKLDEVADILQKAGHAFLSAGRGEAALQVAERLQSLVPDDAALPFLRARALLLLNRHTEAERLMQARLDGDPSDLRAVDVLIEVRRHSEGNQAAERWVVEQARQALQRGDDELARALAFRVKGLRRRTTQERAIVAPLPDLAPDVLARVQAVLEEAEVFRRYDLLAKASAKIDEAEALAPELPLVWERRWDVLRAQPAEADSAARAALSLAKLYVRAGRLEDARTLVHDAAQLVPDDPFAKAHERVAADGIEGILLEDRVQRRQREIEDAHVEDHHDVPTAAMHIPPDLALALAEVDAKMQEGELDQAHAMLLPLMADFPMHAELIASALEQLSAALDEDRGDLAARLEGGEHVEELDIELLDLEDAHEDDALGPDLDDTSDDDPLAHFLDDQGEPSAPASSRDTSPLPAPLPPAPPAQAPSSESAEEELLDLFADFDDEDATSADTTSADVAARQGEALPAASPSRAATGSPPPAPPALDPASAPVGKVSPLVVLQFTPSDDVLAMEPDSALAGAIRARREGRGMEAMMTLEMAREGDYPEAATFESALCHIEMGLFYDALGMLGSLGDSDLLGDEDLALVRYVEGLAWEALDQPAQARAIFERLHEVVGEYFPDLRVRLVRLGAPT